jgi:tetratricopeptide (TPR) repeat protein
MLRSLRIIPIFLLLIFCATAYSQQAGTTRAGRSLDQLGTVHFANSCAPQVQDKLQQGVAMLHSFWYTETEKTFGEVLAADPSCAVANWGIAAILMMNPLAGQGSAPEGAKRAIAAIERGRATQAKTQRERDYIEAVGAYYANWGERTERARQETRARAFEALAARYPDDDEAQVFAALYMVALQSPADQTYSIYLKAANILEKQFSKYPQHPGIAHYLIHSYDAPPIAARGLNAARRYASIAPAAPHALHMPSHIFTRVGAWPESAATNRRSADAALKSKEFDEALHASDYMVYAFLQMARDDDARQVIEQARTVTGFRPSQRTGPYALAAMPARYAIERGDWKAAAQLEPRPSKFPYTDAMIHFSRALGAARTGDPAAAEQEVGKIAALRDALIAAKDKYWATEVEVNWLGAAAWTALAQGKNDEALSLMSRAADMEDRSEKSIVTPGRVLPARELLGDMLMQLGKPQEALAAYEASQQREPERFRGLYGAAEAAAQSGDNAKAKQYYARLMEVADQGSGRPELQRARTFVASH